MAITKSVTVNPVDENGQLGGSGQDPTMAALLQLIQSTDAKNKASWDADSKKKKPSDNVWNNISDAPPPTEASTSSGTTPVSFDSADALRKVVAMGTAQQIAHAMANGMAATDIAPMVHQSTQAINSIGSAVPETALPSSPGEPSDTSTASKYQVNPASSPFGFGGAKMQGDTLVEQKPGFAAGLLNALLGRPVDASARMDMKKMAEVQSLTGEEPLQKGEREKLGLTMAKEVAIKEYEMAQKMAENGNLKPETIMTRFEAASVPFITVRDAQAKIEASAKDPSAAGDLSMIYNFMKVLDPSSVVRESEYATAENARGVPAGIRNMYNKIVNGQKLSKEQRADFLKRSRMIFKSTEAQQKKTTEQFKQLATKNGIEFDKVVRDTGMAQEVPKGATHFSPSTGKYYDAQGNEVN